jgi:hypothetical protein
MSKATIVSIEDHRKAKAQEAFASKLSLLSLAELLAIASAIVSTAAVKVDDATLRELGEVVADEIEARQLAGRDAI